MDKELPLHCDDIILLKSDRTQQGVVDRTHTDIDSHQPFPGHTESDSIDHDKSISKSAFRQFMKDGIPPSGTVLVRWQDYTTVALIPTSKLKLIDRSLLIGDIVKRNARDAMSGVVLNTFTSCTLQPICDVTYQGTKVLKGLLPPGNWDPSHDAQFCVMSGDRPAPLIDIPAAELMYSEMPTEDDLVIYKDWIGRVDAITNQIRIQLSDKCVVEISDEGGEHVDGSEGTFSVGDVAKSKKAALRLGNWIFGKYNPNTPPVGTVISIRTVGVEVFWLETRIRSFQVQPPRLLEVSEIESQDFQVYDRTKRPSPAQVSSRPIPHGQEDTVSNSEPDIRLNLRVRFRDLEAAKRKYGPNVVPWQDRIATYGYDLNVFDIISFHTSVTVQWQDLTITSEKSIEVVPDGDIDDECAAWPSEIAHSLGMVPVPGEENFEQPGRVGVVQSVDSRERMAVVKWCEGAYAYYTKAGGADESGQATHLVSHSIPPAVRGVSEEVSLYDICTSPALNVRRGDIVLIDCADLNPVFVEEGMGRDVSWLGEIVDTLLDGSLVIRLGASGVVRDVVLNRKEVLVAVRSDGTVQADEWDEGAGEAEEGFSDDEEDGEEDSEEGELDWEEEELVATYEDENGEPMDEEEVEHEDWESADDVEMCDAQGEQQQQAPPPPLSGGLNPEVQSENHAPSAETSAPPPPAYLILEDDVPDDHHFASQPATETPIHLRRTMKEHAILRKPSALPSGVYVRTWQSRLDLLRLLIIGPSETPYAHAPFVLDVYLPADFPTKPPSVYFHSWAPIASIGGSGRVNPNLYEDGTVCLSLLGTWSGNSVEEWSAGRSTLLQVVVSLLGLVLVREPYYNEAGYEGLVGSEEARRPSALYSERVGIRAKGFLISALEKGGEMKGLEGLGDVLGWLYRDKGGPRLCEVVVGDVGRIIGDSEKNSGGELDGLRVVSKGACTSLVRVLERLKGVLDV